MSFLNQWFANPWALLGLVVVPLVWLPWLSRRRRVAMRFSGVANLRSERPPWSLRARYVLPVLRSLVLVLLIVSVARPRRADEHTRIRTEGISIQLVVARAGRMAQPDFRDDRGQPMTRLGAVKQAVDAFISGDGKEVKGRPDDLIGLTAFAHYADSECPLTHDHALLLKALAEVQVPRTRDEDGTAIGDALMQAVERIRNIGRRLAHGGAFKIKSRAIILLTDGQQNRGVSDPVQAAEVAAAMGVKIYTIGAAPEFQEQTVGGLLFPERKIKVPVQIDEATLKQVAEETEGRYFRATDTASLTAIYGEIDQLERTVIDEQRYEVYKELAAHWIPLGPVRLPPPLMAALGLLVVEVVLASTRFRKIP